MSYNLNIYGHTNEVDRIILNSAAADGSLELIPFIDDSGLHGEKYRVNGFLIQENTEGFKSSNSINRIVNIFGIFVFDILSNSMLERNFGPIFTDEDGNKLLLKFNRFSLKQDLEELHSYINNAVSMISKENRSISISLFPVDSLEELNKKLIDLEMAHRDKNIICDD